MLYASLASSLTEKKNQSIHSFDLALLEQMTAEVKKEFAKYKRLTENPFDPQRKRNSIVLKKGDTYELVVRGALEEVEKLSKKISKQEKDLIGAWVEKESGNRIIAVARKVIHYEEGMNTIGQENNVELVGLIAFVDPVKESAHDAVKKAQKLGIEIKVLTGDSAEVAGAVAQKIGLISERTQVLTGSEFDALSSHEQHDAVWKYMVYARVSPQQKYHIIQLLQEKKEVGFLGEGINDAPALKIANVALVVDGATDVAREAADIILLKKSLRVIVDGIKEGRETFANTSKYIRATLASNFGNFYTVAIASLFINYLPLLPLQILLINLLTDFPMIAVATDSVEDEELKSPRTYEIKEIALIGTILGIVSSFFDFIFFALFYKISPQVLQTNWFIGSVITELLFLFSIRSRLPIMKAKTPSMVLLGLSFIAFIVSISIPFTAVGRTVFDFITPSLWDIGLIFMIASLYLVATEVVKNLYYKHLSTKR
jgi:Mg2+-importing ATPase